MYGHGAIRALTLSVGVLLTAALGSAGVILSSSAKPVPVAGAPVVAVQTAPSEPPATTGTIPTTTTTAPAPPTTASKPVPRVAPVTTAPGPAPPAPARPPAASTTAERCAEALRWVGARGLALPAGWGYRCPDRATGRDGGPHWGTACINLAPYCSKTAYVAINIDLIGKNDATLRYVVAHEICHAIELVATGSTTEESADACAAAHGAPGP